MCGTLLPASLGPRAIYCCPRCAHVAGSRRYHGIAVANPPAVRTCVVCGKQFPQTPHAQAMKHCSMRCNGRAAERRRSGLPIANQARACAHCGGPIDPEKRIGTIYCSKRCKVNADARLNRRKKAALAEAPAVQTCLVCGEQVPQTPNGHAMKYCSSRCAGRANNRRRRGLPIADPKRDDRACPVCGALLPVSLRLGAIYCYVSVVASPAVGGPEGALSVTRQP